MLFLYTDGVTESFNAQGEAFCVQRLLAAAKKFATRPPRELMMAVLGDLEGVSAGTVQSDDITCLAIRRND